MTLAGRLAQARAELGMLRISLILLGALLVAAGLLVLLVADGPGRPLLPIIAALATVMGLLRIFDRPRPDLLWGSLLCAGAAALWAQVFGLLPSPIQGAF